MAQRFGWLLLAWALTLGCNSAQNGRSRLDPALTAFVPPDAVMLTGVRMDEVRTTPLYQKLLANKRLTQFDDFARRTGFDPRTDVRELIVTSRGADVLMAARGAFNVRESPKGVVKTGYKGFTLYTRGESGVALVDNSTALAGTLQVVRAALDRYKAGDRTGPSGLLARVREIAPQNQLWMVSTGFGDVITNRIPSDGNAANFGRILQSLENMTVVADLRAGINGYITGTCRTEPDAKNLGDAARGLIGMGRLSVPQDESELLRLWDGIKVDQQQRTVKITLDVPQDLVNRVLDKWGPGVSRPVAASSAGESHRPESTRRPR